MFQLKLNLFKKSAYAAIIGICTMVSPGNATKYCSGSVLLETIHDKVETLNIFNTKIMPTLSQCSRNIMQVSQNDHTEQVAKKSENREGEEDVLVVGLSFRTTFDNTEEKFIGREVFQNSLQLGAYSQELVVECINTVGMNYGIQARSFSNAACASRLASLNN